MTIRRRFAPPARAGPPRSRSSASWTTRCARTSSWRSSDALARGLDPIEARREARRQFGGIEQMKEIHRDDRSARWIENLIKDARYGLASLAARTGVRAVAIGVLALGIGANTAMFSLVDGVLFKPMPFPNPERIVRIWETPTPTTSQLHDDAQVSRVEAPEPVVRGAVGGVAVDRHGAGQRRADQAERPLRLVGSLRRLRHPAAHRPDLPAAKRISPAPIAW